MSRILHRPRPLGLALVLASLFAPLLASGCQSTSGYRERIGDPIHSREVVPLGVAIDDPKPFLGREVLVEATVTAVCQHSGCWMQVEDRGQSALVRWQTGCGGKYSFPKDLAGSRLLIQGTFHVKPLSEEEVEHLQEEADRTLELDRRGYEVEASSILVIDEV